MLDLEWSQDHDTKTQCNRLNTSPLHRGDASNKNDPERVKRRMQWEVPYKPFLAPIITDFIRNTRRELYDEKLEDALEMLDLEWSKDDDTKTKCNQLNTSPLHQGNASIKNGPARVNLLNRWPLMTLCFCRNEKCMQKSA